MTSRDRSPNDASGDESADPNSPPAALIEGDERFRKIFEHSNDAIFLLDPRNDAIVDANPRAARMLDYPPEELLATSISAIHPDEVPQLTAFVDSVLRQGHGWTDELSCVTRSGDALPAEISASLISHQGRPCVLAMVRDITERKLAEEALRASETRYRTMYEHTPVMMHSIDRESRLISVNQHWLDTLGYEREEVLGHPGPEFLTDDSRQYAQRKAIPQLLKTGHMEEVELQMVKKDGEVIDVLLSAAVVQAADGVVNHTLAFIVDVTEAKRMQAALHESEERLAGVVESAMDAIVTFDEATREVRLFNVAAEKVLGCPAGTAIGHPIDQFLSDALSSRLRWAKAIFDRGESPFLWIPAGVMARRADGAEFAIEATVSRTVAAGEVLYTLILRDVEERRKAEEALQRLSLEKDYLREELDVARGFGEIVGESKPMKSVLETVSTVAPTDATVLILGETGTGKELVARAIHRRSPRADEPLVRVNCAALPATLVESELFGHEKGAFTGALSRRRGRFELADGGTIFLDEIGDLQPELQAKLLRVLQDGEFERVGGAETLRVEVRVIAATNRNLEQAIAEGSFRSDLFYRLNVFPIELPALRDRGGDIALLARHFVMKYTEKLGKRVDEIPRSTMKALTAYPWSGNVRELENVIERGVILSGGPRLEPGDWMPRSTATDIPDASVQQLDEVQRRHILKALEATGWRVSGDRGAARLLGIKPTTLEARMKKLGIERP